MKRPDSSFPHKPVLVKEVLSHLLAVPKGIFVDATAGSGGHSQAIAAHLGEGGLLICMDRDPAAVELSRKRLSPFGERIRFIRANFAELRDVLADLDLEAVQGVLVDLGMSTYQLDHSGRGFSFNRDEPLDMRMDREEELTAYYLVNSYPAGELEKLLRKYGEEKKARRISRAIVKARDEAPIRTSRQLALLIESVFSPSERSKPGHHPATRSFQALRIAVNRELDNLRVFLRDIPEITAKGGRLVTLSYHSLEDRMVKQAMADWEKGCNCPPDLPKCVCGKRPLFKRISKKAIRPSPEEIKENPRARSATLRSAERI